MDAKLSMTRSSSSKRRSNVSSMYATSCSICSESSSRAASGSALAWLPWRMSFLMWRRIRQAVVMTMCRAPIGRAWAATESRGSSGYPQPTPAVHTPEGYDEGVTIVHGLQNAGQMAWEVGWALALGFLLSALVQVLVPRTRIVAVLGGEGAREVGLATALGAASSSCSYAAVAIAKSLFQRGASLQSAMAFQFASTNLVFELGIAI